MSRTRPDLDALICEVVTFLADPGWRHMTGSIVPVDAGFRLLVSIAPSDARRQAISRISEGA
jgi:hypothetical protein